jgi:hypothetical protein
MERQHPSDAVPVWFYLSLFNISVHAHFADTEAGIEKGICEALMSFSRA